MTKDERSTILLPYFTGAFVAVLLIQSVACSKMVQLGPLTVAGGTLLFPIVFILNDVLTEVYGFTISRKVIWTGFAAQALAALTFWVVQILPPAVFWQNQVPYQTILGAAPRIILGSFLAYLFGEFANSVVLSKMKYKAGGKKGSSQAARFVWSTIVGEALDSIIFMGVAFGGVFANEDLVKTTLTIYLFKVAYEILALPMSMKVAEWVKTIEGIDKIDSPADTVYTPFGS
jgi:uncharacterized integral membrane protein (TIGR00697 family)